MFRAALPGNSRRRVPLFNRPLSSQRGLRGRDPQRRGGCLVVSVPGADERGASVFERVLDQTNAELATMLGQAAITAEERRRMALNVWPRRTSDLVAPFADGGRFRSLTLNATETRLLPEHGSHTRKTMTHKHWREARDVLSRGVCAGARLILGCRPSGRAGCIGRLRRSSDERGQTPTSGQSGAHQFAGTDRRCRQGALTDFFE